jgi:hypothetical protein
MQHASGNVKDVRPRSPDAVLGTQGRTVTAVLVLTRAGLRQLLGIWAVVVGPPPTL